MSNHEGVDCDACLARDIRGLRYKCLLCYDYDLCSACYEARATSIRHDANHPMQCILSQADFALYYGGETLDNPGQTQAYTCPYCSQMGFIETTLREHVVATHADSSLGVVCPVCAARSEGNPNYWTRDLVGHLILEHHNGPSDVVSHLEEEAIATPLSSAPRTGRSGLCRGRGRASRSGRGRRSYRGFSAGGPSVLSPSSRGLVDPIVELLAHLSDIRLSGNTSGSTPTHAPHGQTQTQTAVGETTSTAEVATTQPVSTTIPAPEVQSKFVLPKLVEELSPQDTKEDIGEERSQFVQQLVWSTVQKREDTKTVDLPENTSNAGVNGDKPPLSTDLPPPTVPSVPATDSGDNSEHTETEAGGLDAPATKTGTIPK